jgi:OOP family OmpA-OmpF porin
VIKKYNVMKLLNPSHIGGSKMKKFSIIAVLMLIVFADISFAQLAKDSWAVGLGFNYPRYVTVNITPDNSNYGGYLSLQRNFSEHFGVRLSGGYSHMTGLWTNPSAIDITTSTNVISGDVDFLYYLIPCESISPYFVGGIGGAYRMLKNQATPIIDENQLVAQLNFGFGVEWNIDPEWRIVTEFDYHIVANSEFDGAIGTTLYEDNRVATTAVEHDSYMGIKVGALYYFSQGEPSKNCQLASGIKEEPKDMTDYDRINEMIKKSIPKEVIKEVVVDRPSKASSDKWVLIGVNFDFNSSKLKGEAFPILYDAVKTLLKNPDIKVEIAGYCDYVGSDAYNKKLSQRRAETVKAYLESKGVAAARLTAVGYGKTDFVADNKTAEGRAMNRRIEFKVQ